MRPTETEETQPGEGHNTEQPVVQGEFGVVRELIEGHGSVSEALNSGQSGAPPEDRWEEESREQASTYMSIPVV